MAQRIMDEMFVFDNIMDIDDKGIQVMLRGRLVRKGWFGVLFRRRRRCSSDNNKRQD
jgi:hypothetical protein